MEVNDSFHHVMSDSPTASNEAYYEFDTDRFELSRYELTLYRSKGILQDLRWGFHTVCRLCVYKPCAFYPLGGWPSPVQVRKCCACSNSGRVGFSAISENEAIVLIYIVALPNCGG